MGQNAKSRAKITVKFDPRKINEVKQELTEALEKTGNDLLEDLIDSQMMPYVTGSLQKSTKVDKSTSSQGKVTIVTESAHAKTVYYDPDAKVSKKINKNARAHWFGSYIRGNKKEFFMDTFNKNYQKGDWKRRGK